MSDRTPIGRHGIRKGDTVRWERQGSYAGGHALDAVEYIAAMDYHAYSKQGQHYLLHRPESRVGLGWVCGGAIVSNVDGLLRDVADGIPWEHGDDDFTEGVLAPQAEWDRLVSYSDNCTVWGGQHTEREVVWAASELIYATRRMNGGEPDA